MFVGYVMVKLLATEKEYWVLTIFKFFDCILKSWHTEIVCIIYDTINHIEQTVFEIVSIVLFNRYKGKQQIPRLELRVEKNLLTFISSFLVTY